MEKKKSTSYIPKHLHVSRVSRQKLPASLLATSWSLGRRERETKLLETSAKRLHATGNWQPAREGKACRPLLPSQHNFRSLNNSSSFTHGSAYSAFGAQRSHEQRMQATFTATPNRIVSQPLQQNWPTLRRRKCSEGAVLSQIPRPILYLIPKTMLLVIWVICPWQCSIASSELGDRPTSIGWPFRR